MAWIMRGARAAKNWVAPSEEYLEERDMEELKVESRKVERQLCRTKQRLRQRLHDINIEEKRLTDKVRSNACKNKMRVAADIGRVRTHRRRIEKDISDTDAILLEVGSVTSDASLATAMQKFERIQEITERIRNPRKMLITTSNIAKHNTRRAVTQEAYDDCMEETLSYNEGYEEDQEEAAESILAELNVSMPTVPVTKATTHPARDTRAEDAEYLRFQERVSTLSRK